MDSWLSRFESQRLSLLQISATFSSPARTGAELALAIEEGEGSATLVVTSGDESVQKIKVRFGLVEGAVTPMDGPAPPAMAVPLDLDFPAAALAQGQESLGFDRALAVQMFPHLCAGTSGVAMATLLASTRIVGMDCPGLNSIYSAVTLTWADEADGLKAPSSVSYTVSQAVERLSLLKITMEAPGITGIISAFHRPAPVVQPSFQKILDVVGKGRFAGGRAVVIGGSRGLGEVVAKLLAAGGAQVLMTYHSGQKDADALAAEINAGGGQCQAMAFDVLAHGAAPIPEGWGELNQIYYLATPFITGNSKRPWDRGLFEQFCGYYVSGMINSVQRLGLAQGQLALCQPSTSFLDSPVSGFGEYMAAKAAGEGAGLALAARYPGLRYLCPRLPRVLTDQTNGLVQVSVEDPIPLLLPILDAMRPRS